MFHIPYDMYTLYTYITSYLMLFIYNHSDTILYYIYLLFYFIKLLDKDTILLFINTISLTFIFCLKTLTISPIQSGCQGAEDVGAKRRLVATATEVVPQSLHCGGWAGFSAAKLVV